MARVTLWSEEVAPCVLPPCCIVCGVPAETTVRANLAWVPAWSYLTLFCGFWPFVFVYLIVRRTMTVPAPVCHSHRNHFRWRQWFLPAGLLATLATMLAPVVITPDEPALPTWAFVGAAALFGGTIVVAVWLRVTGVRPLVITRDEITLTGVSPEFATGVETGRADHNRRTEAWFARRDRT